MVIKIFEHPIFETQNFLTLKLKLRTPRILAKEVTLTFAIVTFCDTRGDFSKELILILYIL